MSYFDAFRSDGRRVLVVGGATGMGAAAARIVLDAGADVVVMDHAPVDLDGVQAIDFGSDYRVDVGIEPSTPYEQASLLVYLCSDAAAAVNGQTVVSDAGYLASGLSGSFPDATPAAEFLCGRLG